MRVPALGVLVVLVTLASTTPATAQDPDPKVLFEQGRAAMKERRLDEACALFRQAYDVEPAAASLLNLAACEEERGQLLAARQLWTKSLEVLAADDPRRSISQVHIETIGKRIPRLTVATKVAGATLAIDGKKAPLGRSIELDPGKHVVTLRDGERVIREDKIALEPGEDRKLSLDPETSQPAGTAPGSVTAATDAPPRGGSGLKVAGIVSLGVGAAGIVGFGVTGALYLGKKGSIDDACPSGVCPTKSALDDAGALDTLGLVNAISLGVGVVGVGLGSVLLWQGSKQQTASLELGPGSLAARGRF